LANSEENEDCSWDQNDLIRTEMRKYLNQLLTSLVQLKKCIQEFEGRYSPQSCLNEHEEAVKFYIENPNPFVFDQQIKAIYEDKMK
jgi:hypothetical protein